jgi:crotonobetainyl-CoA:carnitine CoA-transferase CaiB-like acyl-CoA transferase
MVAAYTPERWTRLCELLGLAHIAEDERFATSPLRVANRRAMVAMLTAVFRTRTTDEWLAVLRGGDILCSRVATYRDVVAHPQVAANTMIAEVEHPQHGTIRMPGFPVNSAQANARPHRAAPCCGEHTREVLQEFGFSNADIEQLQRSRAISCA